jgi:hypothetical protein
MKPLYLRQIDSLNASLMLNPGSFASDIAQFIALSDRATIIQHKIKPTWQSHHTN